MRTASKIVRILNEFTQADPVAARALDAFAVSLSKPGILAAHPSIQVGAKNTLRLIGLLNGVAGLDDDTIEAVYDEKDVLLHYRVRVNNL